MERKTIILSLIAARALHLIARFLEEQGLRPKDVDEVIAIMQEAQNQIMDRSGLSNTHSTKH